MIWAVIEELCMGNRRSCISGVGSETTTQLVKGVMIYSMEFQFSRSGFFEEIPKTGEII
jgi:hypothetical protein